MESLKIKSPLGKMILNNGTAYKKWIKVGCKQNEDKKQYI